MEQRAGFDRKLIQLKQAMESFARAMSINVNGFEEIEQDILKNGQIQKFEISIELFWKTMKSFLYEFHGIETVSPKTAIKQLYLAKYTDEKNYETLMEMINDRNRMSHLYNKEEFNQIYQRLDEYLDVMTNTLAAVCRETE
ncbi:MAG: HI0074 family nucleotidyltransferase substrate-binding subunit [Thermodesulfobacteriota bacterium]